MPIVMNSGWLSTGGYSLTDGTSVASLPAVEVPSEKVSASTTLEEFGDLVFNRDPS